ncbi:MAG: ornithine cyclodeaminase family protein [Ignavibacteria bacterium]
MTLVLTKEEVMKVLNMADCIKAVEKAFIELAKGSAILPLRTTIKTEDGISLYMPAYLKESQALACKVVTVYKNNPSKFHLPTTIGKVLLQDPATGEVICIMDGSYLTAVRTGAASGIATRYLANDREEMQVSIFGAGIQAQMQLWAVKEVRNISKALVYDMDANKAKKFAEEMSQKLNLKVEVANSIDEMLQVEIVCTATSSSTPLFDGSKLQEGTHINAIGSHTPDARELDTETIKRALFVGDSLEACFNESGDIIIPLKEQAITHGHFYAELGEILIGKKQGRTSEKEITLFKSNGLAIQDAAAAKVVYERAKSLNIGIEIAF